MSQIRAFMVDQKPQAKMMELRIQRHCERLLATRSTPKSVVMSHVNGEKHVAMLTATIGASIHCHSLRMNGNGINHSSMLPPGVVILEQMNMELLDDVAPVFFQLLG